MVSISRRKRMVAHNHTDTPAFPAVTERQRPFFQESPVTMFLTLGLKIMLSDKVEVEPCFVVAALIIRSQAQDIARDRESTMKPYLPIPICIRRFKEPTNAQLTGIDPVPHNGGVPGGIGRAQSAKASSMMLILLLLSRRRAAPLNNTVHHPW